MYVMIAAESKEAVNNSPLIEKLKKLVFGGSLHDWSSWRIVRPATRGVQWQELVRRFRKGMEIEESEDERMKRAEQISPVDRSEGSEEVDATNAAYDDLSPPEEDVEASEVEKVA